MHCGVPQSSTVDPLLFLLYVNYLLDILVELTLFFADDVKMVPRLTKNMNIHNSSYCRMVLVEEIEPTDQSCLLQLPHHWARGSPECEGGKTVGINDKVLIPRSIEIGFHPFIRGLSASAHRIWYVTLFAKPHCRYQPSRANSKISCKVGKWHASPPLRRETAATGPSFLAAATTSG